MSNMIIYHVDMPENIYNYIPAYLVYYIYKNSESRSQETSNSTYTHTHFFSIVHSFIFFGYKITDFRGCRIQKETPIIKKIRDRYMWHQVFTIQLKEPHLVNMDNVYVPQYAPILRQKKSVGESNLNRRRKKTLFFLIFLKHIIFIRYRHNMKILSHHFFSNNKKLLCVEPTKKKPHFAHFEVCWVEVKLKKKKQISKPNTNTTKFIFQQR